MSVTPRLGGGLGNRLFQYAAAAGLAERSNVPLVILSQKVDTNTHGAPLTILSLFPSIEIDRVKIEEFDIFKEAEEDVHKYVELPACGAKPVLLEGYFQSPKYFPKAGIQVDWENALGGQRGKIQSAACLQSLDQRKRTWMIHFRIGDYMENPMYHVPLQDYYRECLEKVPPGSRLHCFSDEPETCKPFIEGLMQDFSLELTWAYSKTDVNTLYEMSLCTGGAIIGNSTFGWWGAYFGHAEAEQQGGPFTAYYPDQWLIGFPLSHDLIPEWGTIVPV